jgi:hypothetical protein
VLHIQVIKIIILDSPQQDLTVIQEPLKAQQVEAAAEVAQPIPIRADGDAAYPGKDSPEEMQTTDLHTLMQVVAVLGVLEATEYQLALVELAA